MIKTEGQVAAESSKGNHLDVPIHHTPQNMHVPKMLHAWVCAVYKSQRRKEYGDVQDQEERSQWLANRHSQKNQHTINMLSQLSQHSGLRSIFPRPTQAAPNRGRAPPHDIPPHHNPRRKTLQTHQGLQSTRPDTRACTNSPPLSHAQGEVLRVKA